MKKYQYILLDWDGNLCQTLDIWLVACRTVTENREVFKSDEELAAAFGALTQHFEEWGIADIRPAIDEARSIAKKMLPNAELYPDALYVLEKLHKSGKKLALITTTSRAYVEGLLDKHGLAQLFEAVITGDDVQNRKPHPEPLEKGLAALGGDKSSAIMIGDSDKDLGAAQNFGVDSILFYPPEHKKFYSLDSLREHNPTYIISGFKEVLNII